MFADADELELVEQAAEVLFFVNFGVDDAVAADKEPVTYTVAVWGFVQLPVGSD